MNPYKQQSKIHFIIRYICLISNGSTSLLIAYM